MTGQRPLDEEAMHGRIDADGLSLKGSSMSLCCSLETTERTPRESVGERRSLSSCRAAVLL